ncbi:ABC transporter ATP-binding protein [Bradyrhizobium iriomotense]|uniref:ABC transporter ATP-binding protein n=1 Tax=Bradyrhizobium iriomotense TaxID=441950 RepID=UPI001B89FB83|nr:ABC transporter ATP-binding protein [Bradyrhizobium iriomotense]MBR0784745.1 ABC transporter ATP-binding protein [Bradyrhizobium iriomotense]
MKRLLDVESPAAPLLKVEDLSVFFRTGAGEVQATDSISFSLAPGERLGIVGESGCGKTVTGLALLGLLPRFLTRVTGKAYFEGNDLIAMKRSQLRAISGRRLAMIFQEPMRALDPVFTIGEQISETLRAHMSIGKREARNKVIDALAEVGIPSPARRYDDYPHTLSGGMQQRVMIAMALICKPRLLIADEPTTALDVTVQAQIIDLLQRLSESTGTALIFITHDLGVVAELCTRVLIAYAGQVVEDSPIETVYRAPRHPYTSGLFRSMPSLGIRGTVLPSIGGRVPSLGNMPSGCRFRERCGYAQPVCLVKPELQPSGDACVRCVRTHEITLPGAVERAGNGV